MSVRLLPPKFVERVWGTTRLSPLFPDQDNKIGEVWFDAGTDFPLLIKFLFTSDKLSVQVHPDDVYAREVENSRGKTEMWHILSAEPDSTIALGFQEEFTADQVREAITRGKLEGMLNWVPVKAGDTFFATAGTVHAIGAGITLCEIQQNSDITYRLYDYNRPRELHVEKGLAVSNTGRYEGRRQFPVTCDHFSTDLLDLDQSTQCLTRCDGVLIVLDGAGTLDGVSVYSGEVALIGEQPSVTVFPDGRIRLLHAQCSV
ncbi:MAG TPA: class I mannose-6-phosphate isomerase [Bryobacteraceae bacterium]|nr:class I mannose-6-phosphate isomerase [Bryobacteraceae bacterium]